MLNWDNNEVGWISAADTHGNAVARIRAAGPAGDHTIKIYTGYMGQSYLNFEQAPTAYLPRPEFVFQTRRRPVRPSFAESYPAANTPVGKRHRCKLGCNTYARSGSTKARLQGSGLPAGQSLALVWETWSGSRVTSAGYASTENTLDKIRWTPDGNLDAAVTIPDDLGGLHALVLMNGDKELARTYFVVETSIVSISPTSGPAGHAGHDPPEGRGLDRI